MVFPEALFPDPVFPIRISLISSPGSFSSMSVGHGPFAPLEGTLHKLSIKLHRLVHKLLFQSLGELSNTMLNSSIILTVYSQPEK
jgi:hypothetical protein